MSKTYNRIYARGYRAGRKATKWEKFCWLLKNRRRDVEEWLTDEGKSDLDYLVVLFAAVSIAIAGVLIGFIATRG